MNQITKDFLNILEALTHSENVPKMSEAKLHRINSILVGCGFPKLGSNHTKNFRSTKYLKNAMRCYIFYKELLYILKSIFGSRITLKTLSALSKNNCGEQMWFLKALIINYDHGPDLAFNNQYSPAVAHKYIKGMGMTPIVEKNEFYLNFVNYVKGCNLDYNAINKQMYSLERSKPHLF